MKNGFGKTEAYQKTEAYSKKRNEERGKKASSFFIPHSSFFIPHSSFNI